MIEYRCVKCRTELEAPSCLAGWAERCPHCAAENTIPIRFSCHQCQAPMEVGRFEAGQWRKCAKCGAASRAPTTGSGPTKPEVEDEQPKREWTAQDVSREFLGRAQSVNPLPDDQDDAMTHRPLNESDAGNCRGAVGTSPTPGESVGNTDAICPHCNRALEKKPGRKKKCPHCGQFIYVRTRPSDRQQILVTEAQAELIEEQWAIVNGTHDAYLAGKRRFVDTKARLAKRFGREPSDNDVRWGLLNDELLEHAEHRDWGLFRNAKFGMAEILRKEAKSAEALAFYLEVCYLDLNGPNNTGGLTDRELLREFPPWNPKGPTADLAPGIIDRAARIIDDDSLAPAAVEEIYYKRASALHNSLRLPLAPARAWPRVREALFAEGE